MLAIDPRLNLAPGVLISVYRSDVDGSYDMNFISTPDSIKRCHDIPNIEQACHKTVFSAGLSLPFLGSLSAQESIQQFCGLNRTEEGQKVVANYESLKYEAFHSREMAPNTDEYVIPWSMVGGYPNHCQNCIVGKMYKVYPHCDAFYQLLLIGSHREANFHIGRAYFLVGFKKGLKSEPVFFPTWECG